MFFLICTKANFIWHIVGSHFETYFGEKNVISAHSPTGDIIGASSVLAQHISVAHVSRDLHGDPLQVDVLPGSVAQVHAAESSAPARQLSPEVSGVQVAPSLASRHTPAVAIPHGGGVARLQTRAGLTQSPRRQGWPRGSEAEDAPASSAVVAAAADVCGDVTIKGGFQGAARAKEKKGSQVQTVISYRNE